MEKDSWNFVASDNIYEDLLDVFHGAGEELREQKSVILILPKDESSSSQELSTTLGAKSFFPEAFRLLFFSVDRPHRQLADRFLPLYFGKYDSR